MKTRTRTGLRRFQLRLMYGNSYYIERIKRLETILKQKPRTIQIELIGTGEMPADAALLMRSVLSERSPRTQLVTSARSSLQGGSVLIWLLGDRRLIRDDARVYFRRVELPEDIDADKIENWKDVRYRDSFSEFDPEDGDYARVLQFINEYLPVKELAGRLIGVRVLRQFGLIESEKVDQFLATAFRKSEGTLVPR